MTHHDHDLEATAAAMVAPGKGILAADESSGTMSKRLEAVGVPPTADTRRAWRELILTTPDIGRWISGVILYDETIRSTLSDGRPFADAASEAGILPGIKVDTGAKDLAGAPGEKVTEGLDGLRERLAEYAEMGARFAKWRAVITIGDGIPTTRCLAANAHALARYAALCQEAGIVPIVEPEVLMDGDHSIARCEEVTAETLRMVFTELATQHVALEGMVLKPNMVLSGTDNAQQAGVEEVVDATLRIFRRVVPAAVGGIAFLSGGQSDEQAAENLNEFNSRGPQPWPLTFSYGRALLATALETWRGDEGNVAAAQEALAHRARCNAAARDGNYTPEMEREPAPA
ncbi:MAG TPA: class I fructose-bisphosphate aldolase [Egibacteraceae bacterium]|jgi:fructose-bisphosphate aldolase, class I|nr:class I fructose-bisphosphate aldolase [Egibacteraceae bacterium]